MKINYRTHVFLLLALALGLTSSSLWAAEDGLGTNVVRNIRVKTNGVIDLGGTAITNWNQVGSTADVAKLQTDLIAVSNQATYASNLVFGLNNQSGTWATAASQATYASNLVFGLNSQSSTWDKAALEATYGSNTANWASNTAVYASNTAVYASNTAVYASNTANWASNAAVYASNTVITKLDRLNGTATNLAVAGTFVQVVAAFTQKIDVAGSDIAVGGNSFIPIISSNAADVTASIADGSVQGQIIILQGQDNTATVTLTNNPNKIVLCDGVNFTFKQNNTMQLIWNNGKWAELTRIAK